MFVMWALSQSAFFCFMSEVHLQVPPCPKNTTVRSRWDLFREYRDSFRAILKGRPVLLDESSFRGPPALRLPASNEGKESRGYPWYDRLVVALMFDC